PVARIARRWLIVRRANMRKVMKSPDRITGTLTRCIGHEKRRDWRLSVLAIIATVIPSVASIVTRHVKRNVLSNHGFIKGFLRFSQVFMMKTNLSVSLKKSGYSLLLVGLRAKMPHRNIFASLAVCAKVWFERRRGMRPSFTSGVQLERAKRERVL